MVAAAPGVEYAPLFYKPLEKVKEQNLKTLKGDFDKYMAIPQNIKPCLSWWIEKLPSSFKLVSHGQPKIVLFSDSSKKGWGAVNKTTNATANGQWSLSEQQKRINILELKACQLALTTLCNECSNCHVRIYMNKMTSCSYINKFGGKKTELDCLAREIYSVPSQQQPPAG